MQKSFLGYLLGNSDSISGRVRKSPPQPLLMLQIPILSRLKFGDYFSLFAAIAVLALEWSLRICLFFFPFSFVDHLRFHVVG